MKRLPYSIYQRTGSFVSPCQARVGSLTSTNVLPSINDTIYMTRRDVSIDNNAINCDTPTRPIDWLRINLAPRSPTHDSKKHNKKVAGRSHTPAVRPANGGGPALRPARRWAESVDTSPYFDTTN